MTKGLRGNPKPDAWSRVRNTLPIAFVAYAVGLVASGIPASVAASFEDLRALPVARGFEWLDAMRDGSDAATASTITLIGVLGIVVVLSPWLVAAWFAAASGESPPAQCFLVGWRRLPASLGASALFFCASLVVVVAGGGLAGLVHALLAEHPDARSHDLAVLISLAPALFLLVVLFLWHDVARAAAVGGSSPRHAAALAVRSVRTADFGLYLGAVLVNLGLSAVVVAAAWTMPGWLAVILTQTGLFLRTIVRSAWLVRAVDVQRRSRSASSNSSIPASP